MKSLIGVKNIYDPKKSSLETFREPTFEFPSFRLLDVRTCGSSRNLPNSVERLRGRDSGERKSQRVVHREWRYRSAPEENVTVIHILRRGIMLTRESVPLAAVKQPVEGEIQLGESQGTVGKRLKKNRGEGQIPEVERRKLRQQSDFAQRSLEKIAFKKIV